jgi:pyruvate/2-oxoglutarate dehydrogenase complex dihydrolipoamide dehydrogenase (E3) component
VQNADVAIIGAGPAAERAAAALQDRKKILISLPDSPETLLTRHLAALLNKKMEFSTALSALTGACEFLDKNTLRVGNETVRADKFLIIAGCRHHTPKIQGLSETPHSFSTDVNGDEAPRSCLVIGGGQAAVALAQRLADKKTKVTIATNTERLFPREDKYVSHFFSTLLSRQGVALHTGCDVVQTRPSDGKIAATLRQDGALNTIDVEKIIVATGLVPNTQGFHLERAGVHVGDDQAITINEEMRTSASHIWAAGAVTGAHLISLEWQQAEAAAKNMFAPFFDKDKFDDGPLPHVFPTNPPIARLGLTEEEAQHKYKDAHSFTLPNLDEDGFLKVIGRKKSGELLGVHVAGPAANEMVLYFDLVLQAGHSLYDLMEERHFPALTNGHLIYEALRRWKD